LWLLAHCVALARGTLSDEDVNLPPANTRTTGK
jgi:hypothetical protein